MTSSYRTTTSRQYEEVDQGSAQVCTLIKGAVKRWLSYSALIPCFGNAYLLRTRSPHVRMFGPLLGDW